MIFENVVSNKIIIKIFYSGSNLFTFILKMNDFKENMYI